MRWLRSSLQDESGEVMIESTIVIVFTIIVLLAMLSVGFLIYQQAMLNTVACELASGIADSFKYDNRETFNMTSITSDAINGTEKYRNTFSTNSLEKKFDEMAEKYAKERVKATSFGMNGSELNVETKLYFNNVGRMRVEVSVSQECNILFDGALIGLGLMDERLTFSAHAAAECLDITGYAGHVHFFNYVGKKAEDLGVATDLINGIISTVNNIKDTIAIFYK